MTDVNQLILELSRKFTESGFFEALRYLNDLPEEDRAALLREVRISQRTVNQILNGPKEDENE